MRKQYILMILIICLSMGAFAQQTEYLGKMHVTPITFEQKGDSVYVKLNLDMSEVSVESRKSIALIPALVSPTHSFDFPSIEIKGRDSYHVYERQLSLMSKRQRANYAKYAPYTVVKGFKSKGGREVQYTKAVKYEPWMAQARLDLYEDVCGCDNPARRMGVTMLMNQIALEKVIILKPYSLAPSLSYVQPMAEKIKRREAQIEVFLDFAVSKTDIRPDYMDNARELNKLTGMIEETRKDDAVKINKIAVVGYASPEGTLANNQRLSEGRAKAVVDYLTSRFNYPRNMYHTMFGGENWDGLFKWVEASSMPYRKEVLDVITTVPAEINVKINNSRKKALMDLAGGEPYRYMLKASFPSLRKAVCKINYQVKDFDLSEAKEVIENRPQNLSLQEMYLVANTYAPGTQEFIDVFETAVRMFPEDEVANLNAAAAALSRKDTYSAERYLKKVKERTPEYHNSMGVLMMLTGEYGLAKEHLQKAVDGGLKSASQNLEELQKKLDNIREMSEQTDKR